MLHPTPGRSGATSSSWWLMLIGLFYIVMQCDARAVNVSNTWTMPQEGLNVFYRFFRDRISWFEADAVCQFHHANLVTVDNSFQFDATRDLLRELDVNDIVWIGLMRPQSSDRFMWSSNSRPLVADTGYWAESLPLMDAPLCAVIDPIRDYRWHALRCGGPETASFLCEMPVPNWADTCILKDMPNLTMQYMADTASIELIRNCQEEGLLRTTCRGKQDRDRAVQDLICPRERLEAQRINDITNSHFKSLQIINSIPTDNNENNDIELLPMDANYAPNYPEELQTEKNTVQRLIEQFNVDELMQADEPSNMETVDSFYKIPGLIPKPVKKSAKKVLEYPKKDSNNNKKIISRDQSKDKASMALNMDDMMLGDQPQGEPEEMSEQILKEDVTNEILEPLPHIKKTNIHKEDAEKMEKEAFAMKKSMQKNKEIEAKNIAAKAATNAQATTTMLIDTTTTAKTTTTTTTTSTPAIHTTTTKIAATTTMRSQDNTTPPAVSTETVMGTSSSLDDTTDRQPHHETATGNYDSDKEAPTGHTSTTVPPATIGHPMHPQQPRSNVITEESTHPHIKESSDNSHFIPPMLLVKSHYVPPTNKHGHNEHHGHAEDASDAAAKSHAAVNNEMLMTTPKVIDLAAQMSEEQSKQREEVATATAMQKEAKTEEVTAAMTTENGNMKPITVEHKSEQEKRQNSKYMNLEEAVSSTTTTSTTTTTIASPTTTTTSTLKPLTTTAKVEKEDSTWQTSTMLTTGSPIAQAEDAPKSLDAAPLDLVAATKTIVTQELKPQTDMANQEAIETAKRADSLVEETKARAGPNIEETTTPVLAAETSTADAVAALATTTTTPEALKEAKDKNPGPVLNQTPNTNAEEPQQLLTTTTQRTEAPYTSAPATDAPRPVRKIILATDPQDTQKSDISDEMKQDETENPKASGEPDAIVSTTEMLTTTTATAQTSPATKSTSTTGAPATTTTTMTTTEAIATTTTKAGKSTTEMNANATTLSVNYNPAAADEVAPSTASLITATANTNVNTNPSASLTTDNLSESSTEMPASESSPETTRNFLKVTTEMPFKPNRRRSLTKPETVSYMKKILG